MYNLPDINFGKITESRKVADMIGKHHRHLMRDIRGYAKIWDSSNAPKVPMSDFFIESTYKDAKGETRPCYLLTKMGCEFVAHKLNGKRGILFTAAYVTKFHEMQEALSRRPAVQGTYADALRRLADDLEYKQQTLPDSKVKSIE